MTKYKKSTMDLLQKIANYAADKDYLKKGMIKDISGNGNDATLSISPNEQFTAYYSASGMTHTTFTCKCGITADQLKNYMIGRTKIPDCKMQRAKEISEKVGKI